MNFQIKPENIRSFLILLVLTLNIGCDRVTKNAVRKNIAENEFRALIPDHLTLTKVENTGAFLSVGNQLGKLGGTLFLVVLPSLVILFSTVFVFSKTQLSGILTAGISFIIAGGVGNLYDRILHGSVTDFIHLKFGLLETGIFNVADISITIGFFLIIAGNFIRKN